MSNWGDPAELAELIGNLLDQHGAALALYAAQWSPTPDDCVQEALIELARTRPLPDQPVAWVYRVVKCRALNSARAQRRRTQREQAAWTSRLTPLTSRTDGERAELLDVLDQLTIELREIVVLKVWGNLTFAEIAAVVDCSASTIHRQYQAALETLREKWTTPCPVTTKSD
jgi:RNA polymerase sigma-70 factor (ECF subfamily)